jgi:hypothetical protein
MRRRNPALGKKCRRCKVAARVGGCLFGCNRKEKAVRELELLIRDADSHTDPLVELLQQCPEAFKVGQVIEAMLQSRKRACDPNTPPAGTVMIPFG